MQSLQVSYTPLVDPITECSISFNAVLIVFRIWSVDRAAGKFRQTKSSLKPAIAAVVESGLIYSVSLVCLLAVYLSGSWAHFIILDALTPIIVSGINFWGIASSPLSPYSPLLL